MVKVVLIVETQIEKDENIKKTIEYIKENYSIETKILEYQNLTVDTPRDLVLLYLSDEKIKHFFKGEFSQNCKVGILPCSENVKARMSYAIAKDLYEAIDDCHAIS